MADDKFRREALQRLKELQGAAAAPSYDESIERARLAARLRAFHAEVGEPSEPELTRALGDSPSERDIEEIPSGERRRKGSSLTRTA